MMYVALRTDDPRGAVAFVRVALPLDAIQAQVAELRWIIWSAAAVAAIAGMLLAFWLGRRITRPLKELTAGAARIAAGEHRHRVFALGRDEMGTLARAFNTMSERLGEQFAQLEEDRAQLRAVLSGMVEGVIAIDAEERIVFANQCAGRLLGFADDTAVGRKLWEVVRQRSLQQLVQRARTADGTHHEELKWETPAVKNLAVHAARLPGAPGQEIVLVFHDTTELRRLERVRQEFVANVSHELKTPLSVITACAETLLEGAADDPEHRASFVQQIAEQAERLHALILDLLSLARIEAGTEALELQRVPLGPAVAACLERHRARADAKNLVLEAVPPEELRNGEIEKLRNAQTDGAEGPSPVPQILNSSTSQFPDSSVGAWADGEAVAEILDNLVDNAVKYTPPGGRIRVRWQADDSQAVVEVEDTGIGIPDRDLPRIFERFYRVDKARSRELGGTGLGLSIVKHLVQAMHGRVSAASRLGEGSIFTVRLPLVPSN